MNSLSLRKTEEERRRRIKVSVPFLCIRGFALLYRFPDTYIHNTHTHTYICWCVHELICALVGGPISEFCASLSSLVPPLVQDCRDFVNAGDWHVDLLRACISGSDTPPLLSHTTLDSPSREGINKAHVDVTNGAALRLGKGCEVGEAAIRRFMEGWRIRQSNRWYINMCCFSFFYHTLRFIPAFSCFAFASALLFFFRSLVSTTRSFSK